MSTHKRRALNRLIAQRKRALEWEPQRKARNTLTHALDMLNAPGMLEQVQRTTPGNKLCYGPLHINGSAEGVVWAAAVIWYRHGGYHNYGILNLLGIWAVQQRAAEGQDAPPLEIICGTAQLNYTGQPYNAEAYFHTLRKDFRPYYGRVAGPPATDTRLLTLTYDPASRLALRGALDDALAGWWQSQPPAP